MKTCPRCGGEGEVPSPGWFWVQLFEGEGWHDWVDFPTRDAAIAKAIECGWGRRARVLGPRHRVLWQGLADPWAR